MRQRWKSHTNVSSKYGTDNKISSNSCYWNGKMKMYLQMYLPIRILRDKHQQMMSHIISHINNYLFEENGILSITSK